MSKMFTAKSYESFFHKLHNHLRDGETSLTGMAALNEINNFILLIFIEPRIDELFNKKCDLRFSHLCKMIDEYNSRKDPGLRNKQMHEIVDKYTEIIIEYCENEYIKKYIDTESSKMTIFHNQRIALNKDDDEKVYNIKTTFIEILQTCRDFIFNGKEINKKNIKEILESMDSDVIGDAYENFKENEVGNQGKTMGQYFSPRVIIKYCIQDYIKPKYNELCYESSVGTGGFLHYMNKYVRENFTKEQHKHYRDNCIYANDKTEDLMKPLYVNLLLHDIGIKNIHNRNSLSFKNCKKYLEMFDNFVGNPPYGLKHKAKYVDYFIKINDNKYNYFPKFMKASGPELVKDSMGQFMFHCVNSLKVGGRFSLIIDRGILNNGTENKSWQKQLREWLLCNCDLQQIVLLPKGIFKTTNFDTAIICGVKKVPFINHTNKKLHTDKVNVFIGKFEDEKNKEGLIVDKKPDLVWEIKDIVSKDWSLKYDDYVEKEDVSYNGIVYKSLGEVCEFKRGKSLTTDKMLNNGYSVIGGGVKLMDKYYDTYNTYENQIIMSNDGAYAGFLSRYNQKLFITSHCNKCIAKNINETYLYYFLKISFQNKLIIHENDGGFQKGNAQPSININKMYKDINIPILPDEHQQEIIDFMDNVIGDNYFLLDRMVQEFKDIDLFKFLLVKDYDSMEYTINYIEDLIRYETTLKRRFEIEKKICFKMIKAEYKALGEVCEFQIGSTPSTKTSDYYKNGTYLWCSVGDLNYGIINDTSKKLTQKAINETRIKIVKKDSLMMSFKLSIGKLGFASQDMYCNEAIAFFDNYKGITKRYLYYVLLVLDYNKQKHLFNSQISQSLNKSTLAKLQIPVPSLEDQEKIIKQIEAIEEKDSDYNKALEGMKQIIYMIENSIEMTIDKDDEQETKSEKIEPTVEQQEVEQQEVEQQEVEQEDSEDEDSDEEEYEYFEYKGKKYIQEGNKAFKISKDGSKGRLYGKIKDDKIIKAKPSTPKHSTA